MPTQSHMMDENFLLVARCSL